MPESLQPTFGREDSCRSTAVTVNILITGNQRRGGAASALPLALGFAALPLSALVKIAHENKLCS